MKEVTIPVPDEVLLVSSPDGTMYFPGDQSTIYRVTVQVNNYVGSVVTLAEFVTTGGSGLRVITERFDAAST